MICWNNSITIQELSKMYRLDFIDQSEQLRLKDTLTSILDEWMNLWSLNKSYTLNFQPISYKAFSSRPMVQYVAQDSKVPIFFSDDHFSWDKFIFNNVDGKYINHYKYFDLLDRIKKDFIDSIFKKNNVIARSNKVFSKSIDAYFLVKIGSELTGYMEFIAPHSYFMHLIERRLNKRSEKITGDRFSLISKLKTSVLLKMKFDQISFSDLIHMENGSMLKSNTDVENNFLLSLNNKEIAQVFIGKRGTTKAYLIKGKKNG